MLEGLKKSRKFLQSKTCYFGKFLDSGLIAIIGSLNVEPGDEIIVTPWTMCATATAILHWNCIPVFADIDKKNFCIDPLDIKKKLPIKQKL